MEILDLGLRLELDNILSNSNTIKLMNVSQGVLVNAAPNPEVKVNKSRSKKPGTSGRLHRNETGDWVWSSDEEDSDDETIQKKGPKNKQVRERRVEPLSLRTVRCSALYLCCGYK